jgi:hypothetical protein
MRMMPPTVALVLAVVCTSRVAHALCPDWKASGEYGLVDSSELVFEGKVVAVESLAGDACGPSRVTLRVRRTWKGAVHAEQTIWATGARVIRPSPGPVPTQYCGVVEGATLEVTRSYIVFTSEMDSESKRRFAIGCGATTEANPRLRSWLDKWKAEGKAWRTGGRTTG